MGRVTRQHITQILAGGETPVHGGSVIRSEADFAALDPQERRAFAADKRAEAARLQAEADAEEAEADRADAVRVAGTGSPRPGTRSGGSGVERPAGGTPSGAGEQTGTGTGAATTRRADSTQEKYADKPLSYFRRLVGDKTGEERHKALTKVPGVGDATAEKIAAALDAEVLDGGAGDEDDDEQSDDGDDEETE